MLHLQTVLLVVILISMTACLSGAPEAAPVDLLSTPLERNGFGTLTTHAELVEFVDQLGEKSDLITVRTLGASTEGRRIPYLKISNDTFGADDEKLTVLLFAQQHGNEPSGKEAALMLARDFARGIHDELLQHMDVLLVPQVNPDGSERHQRRNAHDVDLNRSHFILDAEETIALRTLFQEWLPEITLDVHEYQPWVSSWAQHGYIRLFDVQYGVPTNLNTAASIRALAEEQFLPYVEEHLAEQGFTFHNYLVGSPDFVRYSTTNINDGRQSFAMLNTFSLILEGRRARGEEPAGNIERRAAAQLAAIEALLSFSAENNNEMRRTIRQEREALRQGTTSEFVLTMDRKQARRPLTIPVHALRENNSRITVADTMTVTIEHYYPLVAPREVTSIPEAYLIPAAEHDLIELFAHHRIQMEFLPEGYQLNVERYTIDTFRRVTLANATFRIPDATLYRDTHLTQEGDVLVPTTQLARNLIATALEPESKHGVLQYEQFSHLGDRPEYPILRVTSH